MSSWNPKKSTESNESIIITKDTMNRLIKDIKEIILHPLTDNGIYYSHDEENMLKGYAMIVGPHDTPYFGGYYFFELYYPANYPYSPPHVVFCTNAERIRFNPNLYITGKVCLSLLNTWRGEQWTSCQSISSVLLTLCTVLIKNPLLNEPGVKSDHFDFKKYNTIIKYKNIDIAVLQILQKKQGVFLRKFDIFNEEIKSNFVKNADKIRDYLEKKKDKEMIMINTGLYNMHVKIDWKELYDKFIIIYNTEIPETNNEKITKEK